MDDATLRLLATAIILGFIIAIRDYVKKLLATREKRRQAGSHEGGGPLDG